jgi:hypothetical protein
MADFKQIKCIEKISWFNVATPLWGKCEDEIHTPEIGTWESFRTPETLEFNCKGLKHLALGCYLYHWKDIEV